MLCAKKTFSLVELLVVISIVILLMSLLNPSLKNLIKQTHQIECKNKMSTIYRSMMVYSSDENDHYPPLYKEADWFDPLKITWDDYLAGYDGRENVSEGWLRGWGNFRKDRPVPEWDQYMCPSNPLDRVRPVFGGGSWGIVRDYEITRGQEHVGSNGLKSLVGVAGMNDWSAKVTEVHIPSSTFILAERIGPRFMGYPFSAGMVRPQDHHPKDSEGTFVHDFEYFNYLYADGHIEFLHYLEPVQTSDGSSIHIRNSPWNYQR